MLDTTATVTAKGQVTIPAEMRRALGIRPHDRVRLEVEDGRLTLRREEANGERAKRKHFVHGPPLTGTMQERIDAETDAAERAMAEDALSGMR